jgi:serine/threonine-protein kinase
VHGDPKPSNVLVDEAGTPWLLDLGQSEVADPHRLQKSAGDWLEATSQNVQDVLYQRLPKGQVAGTPAFMSPEQARGEGLDEKTDIYVLGATLFYILTGQLAHGSQMGVGELLRTIASRAPTRPRAIDRKIPRKLEYICLKAMAPDRGDRYARASDIGQAVGSWLAR